ncbi:MAG: tetratricopeptide repeat protein [Longispora sp.]|nr:tetratricopeptide repeat protein [Longispora sp. (in: high G+C Gram-positive bacteria)]
MARRSLRFVAVSAVGLVVLGAGGVVAYGGLWRKDTTPVVKQVGSGDDTSAAIARAERRVRELPGDWVTLADLGLAYVERARATGDPSYYTRAQAALEKSLAVRSSENAGAHLGLGALAAARHDFTGALTHADDAIATDAYMAAAHGVRADALIELGRYDEGSAAVQRMIDLRPDASSYARASYALELRGDTDGARHALERALQSAPSVAATSFALYQLGELAFHAGDLDAASSRYEQSLARNPEDVGSRAGRARVLAARGQTKKALAEYRTLTTRLPNPAYLAEYGDLLAASGDMSGAKAQYDLVRVTQRLLAAQGMNTDLELALFDADHEQPTTALTAAQAAYAKRPNIFAADALAWALHANGRSVEALPYARQAQRLETRNALLRYHLGVIEAAVGERDAARTNLETALAINPHFSTMHAPKAKAALANLGGAR